MIVRFYELVTAPSYIHTRRCHHASRLPRSSHIHDHQGAYARAYATILCTFIVNPCRCGAPLSTSQLQSTYNNRNIVPTTTNDNRTQVHCEHHKNNIRTDPNITPPLGSVQPSALLVHSKCTGAVGQISFRFPCRLKHRVPMPLDKILCTLRVTTPTRMMIKNVFHFVLARLISSRTENWYVSCIGIRAIVADSGLELRGIKHVMNMPLARQLKAKGHSTDSSNDTKRSNKLSSECRV